MAAKSKKEFYTVSEALQAVELDLKQYRPQPELYAWLWEAIFGVKAHCYGPRIHTADGRRFQHQLCRDLICSGLQAGQWSKKGLARLCAKVFECQCEPGEDFEGQAGIWLDPGMTDFACTRCGHCCLNLDFHLECLPEDVDLWRTLGREDILAWVGQADEAQGTGYRIWKRPGTPLYAQSCPWLRRTPGDTSFVCVINDVKPSICRSYPGTMKHARMTGCKGVPSTP